MYPGGVLGSNKTMKLTTWSLSSSNDGIISHQHTWEVVQTSEMRSSWVKLIKSLGACSGELCLFPNPFLYLSSSRPWRRGIFSLSTLGHDAQHRPRNSGASSHSWKLLTLWTETNPFSFKRFHTSICHGDKNVCPKMLCDFLLSPLSQIKHPFSGEYRFGFVSVLGAWRTAGQRYVFFNSLCEQCSGLSASPREKKALGSRTATGKANNVMQGFRKWCFDIANNPLQTWQLHRCS